jgi:hypothetical protein
MIVLLDRKRFETSLVQRTRPRGAMRRVPTLRMRDRHPFRRTENQLAAVPPSPPPAPLAEDLPVWTPQGEQRERLRPEMQTFLERSVGPMYRQLVSNGGGVQNFVAETMIRLSWLETLQQLDLSDDYNRLAGLKLPASVDDDIESCIRVGMAKVRMVACLMRLQTTARQAALEQTALPATFAGDQPRLEKAEFVDQPDTARLPGATIEVAAALQGEVNHDLQAT